MRATQISKSHILCLLLAASAWTPACSDSGSTTGVADAAATEEGVKADAAPGSWLFLTIDEMPATLVTAQTGYLLFTGSLDHRWQVEVGGDGPGSGTLVASGEAEASSQVAVQLDGDELGVGEHSIHIYAHHNEATATETRELTVRSDLSVMLLYGYNGSTDADLIAGSLAQDPRIGSVVQKKLDVVNPSPPFLEELSDFDVVVYWWNDSASKNEGSRAAFGNRLADFLDDGGAVVTLPFSQGANSLTGRLLAESYLPLRPPLEQPYSTDTPAALVPSGHPILDGVDSVDVAFRAITVRDEDADLVADWSDGRPLAAQKGAIVSLAVPLRATDLQLAGDWDRLLANSIAAASAQAP